MIHEPSLLAIFNLQTTDWIIILIIALLIFGRRLPE
jgi:Sec-independent protein translocase protein TatA